jgi:hypothetical protein
MKEFLVSIINAFKLRRAILTKISYPQEIINKKDEAYKKAWEARDFEIHNYWSRTAYFWAFQVASFTGYFAVIDPASISQNNDIVYCVNCIGFITALAWTLTNAGSKKWQKNWEDHVDILQDGVTGPLYKTISMNMNFSVSNINKLVSLFFTFIWVGLGIKFFHDNITLPEFTYNGSPAVVVIILTVLVLTFSYLMIFGYGKTNHVHKRAAFYDREIKE